jgi:hypothetical protein
VYLEGLSVGRAELRVRIGAHEKTIVLSVVPRPALNGWWRMTRVRGTSEGSLRVARASETSADFLDSGGTALHLTLLSAGGCNACSWCWNVAPPEHAYLELSCTVDGGAELSLRREARDDDPTVFALDPVPREDASELDRRFPLSESDAPSGATCEDFLHNASRTLTSEGKPIPDACRSGPE